MIPLLEFVRVTIWGLFKLYCPLQRMVLYSAKEGFDKVQLPLFLGRRLQEVSRFRSLGSLQCLISVLEQVLH